MSVLVLWYQLMIDEILLATETNMRKSIEALRRELMVMRTGHATPALLDSLRVDYYGVSTPLNQIATISAPEARLLVIQPWDRNTLSSIEKAIIKSDLGLNPTNDGRIVRLVIPQLTEERRKALLRVVRKCVEDGKITLRNLRREAVEDLRRLEQEKKISQDERQRAADKVQKIIDSFVREADQIGQNKEAEIMEF